MSILRACRDECVCACVHACSYAFSLEEANYKDKAEEVAREALGLEKRNPWGIHALSEP